MNVFEVKDCINSTQYWLLMYKVTHMDKSGSKGSNIMRCKEFSMVKFSPYKFEYESTRYLYYISSLQLRSVLYYLYIKYYIHM